MLPFHGFVLAHGALVLALAAWRSVFTTAAYQLYIVQFVPLYFLALPATLVTARMLLAMVRSRAMPGQDSRDALPETLGRLVSAGATLATFILFMGSFTTFKTLMPALRGGFLHDGLQADIDAFLHGVDPGPALLEVLGYPLLLQGIRWNYLVVWMALTFIPVFFVAVGREARGIRLRYFLSFVLVWAVLGNLIACLFLSAGPAFYAQVTGDAARFGAQMQFLNEQGEGAFRAYLWQTYLGGTIGLGTGISAFPSVHVGAAMMNALFLREINRFAGLAGFAYVGIVSVSSVLLGWHYAIDGYVSILVVLLLHIALRRVLGGRRNTASEPASTAPASPAAT